MPTPKQEKLAEAIIENARLPQPATMGELLEKVGYAKSVSIGKPGEIIEREGVQEALAIRGFTPEKAKEVVASIMTSERVKPRDRLTAADMTFKIHGSYAPEKRVVQQTTVEGSPQDYVEAKKLALEYEQKLLDTLK